MPALPLCCCCCAEGWPGGGGGARSCPLDRFCIGFKAMKSHAAASGVDAVGRGNASLLALDPITLLPVGASLFGGAGGRPLNKYATELVEPELSVSLLSDRLLRFSMHNLACVAASADGAYQVSAHTAALRCSERTAPRI